MGIFNNSIEDLLGKSNQESGNCVVSDEDYLRAEKEINEKMEKFSIEQRSYFNESAQSASKAYLTF